VLKDLAITPVDPSIAKATQQPFVATGTFSDSSTQDLTNQVTWASSNTTVATITSGGLATGLSAGTTNISATFGGLSDSVTLVVTNATLVSIALSPLDASIAKRTSVAYTATGTFSDSSIADITTQVTWTTGDAALVTIATGGIATGVSAGTTTVTASLSGVSQSTNLTATNATLVSIAVTPANARAPIGVQVAYTAIGTFSDNTTQNLTTTATWASSNTNVAKISNRAGTRGVATVRAADTTTISATFGGKTGSTTLTCTGATLVSIAVTPNPLTLAVGQTRQMTAIGTYSDSTTVDLTSQASGRPARGGRRASAGPAS
jgi:hypothetical protein